MSLLKILTIQVGVQEQEFGLTVKVGGAIVF